MPACDEIRILAGGSHGAWVSGEMEGFYRETGSIIASHLPTHRCR